MGLYQVNMMLSRKNEKGESLPPVMSTYYVLADNEAGAISQVDDVAAGGKCLSGLEARDAGVLTGVAYRIPLYIRGWGNQTV